MLHQNGRIHHHSCQGCQQWVHNKCQSTITNLKRQDSRGHGGGRSLHWWSRCTFPESRGCGLLCGRPCLQFSLKGSNLLGCEPLLLQQSLIATQDCRELSESHIRIYIISLVYCHARQQCKDWDSKTSVLVHILLWTRSYHPPSLQQQALRPVLCSVLTRLGHTFLTRLVPHLVQE